MSYPRYPWIGNRISEEDMASLYRLKQKTRKPITVLVAEAVTNYLSTRMNTGYNPDCPDNRAVSYGQPCREVSDDMGAEKHREL